MNIRRAFVALFFSVTTLLFLLAVPVLAGGGPVEFSVYPNSPLNPGEQYVVNVKVSSVSPSYPPCANCYIKLAFQNPQDSDYIAQSNDRTDDNGRIYAKVISRIPGNRTIYVAALNDSDGRNIEANSIVILNYIGKPTIIPVIQAPEMVYPQDRQTIDLEGAYMFKVTRIEGASGYLFGLFQDDIMVYENYRDAKTLSADGEFALWEGNPAHAKFKAGEIKVMIRALVNNEWTDARTITITLKPRGGQEVGSTPIPMPVPSIMPTASPILPTIPPSQTIVIVRDSSASAQLQKKVEELEQKLNESQQKQSTLENRLEQIIHWIKQIFPFFE